MRKFKRRLISIMVIWVSVLTYSYQGNAQQWFLKHVATSGGNDKPDFNPGGSIETADGNILLYGTVGYYNNVELDGNPPGGADVILYKNTPDGDNIWTVALGTTGDDRVARVVQIKENVFVVAGHRGRGTDPDAFLVRVRILGSGSSVTCNIQGQPQTLVNCQIRDMIRVQPKVTGGEIIVGNWDEVFGIAICGYDYNVDQPFALRCNDDLNFSTPNTWKKYYDLPENHEWLKLNSLVQLTVDNTLGGLGHGVPDGGDDGGGDVNPIAASEIAICGSMKDDSYENPIILKVNTNTGAVKDDYFFLDESILYTEVNCSEAEEPLQSFRRWNGFEEIIETRSLDIVVSSSRDHIHSYEHTPTLLKINSNLSSIDWLSSKYEKKKQYTVHGNVEVLETAFGYTLITSSVYQTNSANAIEYCYFNPEGEYISSNFAFDGIGSLEPILLHTTDNDVDFLNPWKDYALSCDALVHMPVLERKQPGTDPGLGYDQHNLTHAKNGYLVVNTCVESEFDFESDYCDDLNVIKAPVRITASDFRELEPANEFLVENYPRTFSIFCDSDCEFEACSEEEIEILVCVSDFGPTTLTVPNSGSYQSFLWGTMETTPSIDVNAYGTYTCYAFSGPDQTGCLTIFTFIVQQAPELTVTLVEDGISCPGMSDGDFIMTASNPIVHIQMDYTPIGGLGMAYGTSVPNIQNANLSNYLVLIGGAGSYNFTFTDIYGCTYSIGPKWMYEPDPMNEFMVECVNDPTGGFDNLNFLGLMGGTLPIDVDVEEVTTSGSTTSNLCTYNGVPNSNCGFVADPSSTYILHFTDANGCTASATYANFECSNKKYIESREENDIAGSVDISLYPNPASDNVTIESPLEMSSIALYDMTGKQIRLKSLSGQSLKQSSIDVGGITAGIYMVRVSLINDVTTHKLLHVY